MIKRIIFLLIISYGFHCQATDYKEGKEVVEIQYDANKQKGLNELEKYQNTLKFLNKCSQLPPEIIEHALPFLLTNPCKLIQTLEHDHCQVGYFSTLTELSDKSLASGYCQCGQIKIWKFDSTNRYIYGYSLVGHELRVNSIIQMADKRLATCSLDGTIKIWKYDSQMDKYICQYTLMEQNRHEIQSIIEISEERLVSGSINGIINIWRYDRESDNYIIVDSLADHGRSINCIKELSNKKLVTCANDGTIKVWEFDANKSKYICKQTLVGHNSYVNFIVELSDKKLASCSYNGLVKIWRSNKDDKYKCINTFKAHEKTIYQVKELSTKSLVTCSADGTIKIWNLDPKSNEYICKNILKHDENGENVYCILELFDKKLASCGRNGKIKIWDRVIDIKSSNDYEKYKIYKLYKLLKQYPYHSFSGIVLFGLLWKYKDKIRRLIT